MKKVLTLLFLLTISLSINNNIFAQANSVGLNGSFIYNSIATAYTAIGVVGSPQLIELSAAYTGANETAPVSLTFKTGVSSSNTITIRPSAGANGLTLSKASANSIFRLDSCSYVILDGRPGGVTSSPSNYFNVSNTTASGTSNAVIAVGATNCIIRFINATGVSSASGCRVINLSGSVTSPSNNNLVTNNVVRGGLRGIQDFGFSAPTFINNNNVISNNDVAQFNAQGILVSASFGSVVTNNRVHTVTPVATGTQLGGIQAGSSVNAVVTGNTIDSIASSNAAATAFFLLVDFGTNSKITNNKVTNVVGTAFISQISSSQVSGLNGTFSNNEISNISLSRASSFNVGIAITGFASATTYNITNNNIVNLSSSTSTNIRGISSFVPLAAAGTVLNIRNNFISITAPNNTATAIFGILVGNTAGVGYVSNLYYNSIRIGGTNIGGTVNSVNSYGILKSDNNAGSVYRQKHNNVLVDRTADIQIQLGSWIGNTTGTLDIDSNNYSATDTLLGFAGAWVDTLYKNVAIASYRAYAAPYEANTTFNNVNKLSLTMNFQSCPDVSAVTVELRSATSPYNVVETVSGMAGGAITTYFNFANAISGVPYYLVVKSVNMVETWSASTVTFSSSVASYNFTTSLSQAYGSNQVLKGGIPSVYQGDANQDGFVDGTDVVTFTYANVSSSTTSPATDFNCDGFTDLSDLILDYNNAGTFVQVVRPPVLDGQVITNAVVSRNTNRQNSVGLSVDANNSSAVETTINQLER
ncbi:MAG TPA: hypothetical protein PKC91_13705 [Ignavibacteria bacterium]|nr:hypothetical protein [Ignavibacteria bacterium]